jgi:hypothetical protein
MLQLVVNVIVIVMGLVLALFLDAPGEMRIFGWFVAAIGVVGLGARAAIIRRGSGRRPGRPR